MNLFSLYAEIAAGIRSYREISNLRCPKGCGKCCDKADIEVTRSEAEFIASYILQEIPELEGELPRRIADKRADLDSKACIFYDPGSDEHCRIYPARPLVCRAFGDSGFKDKTGGVYFEVCPHMTGADRFMAGGGIVKVLFNPKPPILSDFEDLISLHAEGRTSKRPIGEAVFTAFLEVRSKPKIQTTKG